MSTHRSPSVTARLALDRHAIRLVKTDPFWGQFPQGCRIPGFCGPSREKGLRNELLSITVLWVVPPSPTCSTWLHQARWTHQDDELMVSKAVLPAVPFQTGQVGGRVHLRTMVQEIMWVGFIYFCDKSYILYGIVLCRIPFLPREEF